jgi:hypothetical protein
MAPVGLEPTWGVHPSGFSYHYGFRHPIKVCGLDFTLTLAIRLRSQPSSLYTFFLLPL